MLPINLLELLCRFFRILFLIEEIETLIVELVRGLVGSHGIFVEQAAGAEHCRQHQQDSARRPFARLAPDNLDADATPVHGSGKKPLKTGLRLGRIRVLPRINPCPRSKKKVYIPPGMWGGGPSPRPFFFPRP